MNRNFFYKINTVNGDIYLSNDFCDELYDYYVYGGRIFGYEINVTKDEFNKIFSAIYSNIESVLSLDEIKKAFLQYIQLIMADARSGKYVDINYFIICLDYISLDIMDNIFLRKVRKPIKSLKKSLKHDFVSSIKK